MKKAYGIALYKQENNQFKLLLCKSIKSKTKYGFLKGIQEDGETNKQTAIREFEEESGISLKPYQLEEFFLQKNTDKIIGVYMVNYYNIKCIDTYFDKDKLKDEYICNENVNVRFFDIQHLPPIKKKQINIIRDIVQYVNKKA